MTGNDVFISYSRETRARAEQVVKGFEAEGWRTFFDDEIRVGESWDERIEREILSARAVVVLWSPKAVESQWVKNEARVGLQKNKLAPAIIETCDLPLEFSHAQSADLRNWNGSGDDPEWRKLVGQVAGLLEAPIPAEPQGAPPRPMKLAMAIGGLAVAAAMAVAVIGLLQSNSPSAKHSAQSPITPGQVAPEIAASGQLASGEGAPASSGALQSADAAYTVFEVRRLLEQLIAQGYCTDAQAMVESIGAQSYLTPVDLIAARAQVKLCKDELPPVERAVRETASSPVPTAPASASETSQVPSDFLNRLVATDRSPLADADWDRAAARLGAEPAVVEAIGAVQSGRLGHFDPSTGRPNILFEPHIFSRKTAKKFDADHPSVSYERWNPRAYPRTQAERWEQLRQAYALDPDAALESTSFGRFQTMGFNFSQAGFPSVAAYVTAIATSEARNLDAFVEFLRSDPRLLTALQQKDWKSLALGYNGPGALNPGQEYDRKMADAYAAAVERRKNN